MTVPPFILFFVPAFFVLLLLISWLNVRKEEQKTTALAKIVTGLRERHPDDPGFVTMSHKPNDKPEVVRFRAHDNYDGVVEIAIDGSRVEVEQILLDTH